MAVTDQVYAVISPETGRLMYAGRKPDLAAAIVDYGRQIAVPFSMRLFGAATGLITWYRLPADTKIDHWDYKGGDGQWSEWTAAEPQRIPKHIVWAATVEAMDREGWAR